jgi:hypothetical protein
MVFVVTQRSRTAVIFGLVVVVAAAVIGASRFRRLSIPWDVPLWSIVWMTERGVLVWFALVLRIRGGVRYHGHRLPRSAHHVATLRRRGLPRARLEAGPSRRMATMSVGSDAHMGPTTWPSSHIRPGGAAGTTG